MIQTGTHRAIKNKGGARVRNRAHLIHRKTTIYTKTAKTKNAPKSNTNRFCRARVFVRDDVSDVEAGI